MIIIPGYNDNPERMNKITIDISKGILEVYVVKRFNNGYLVTETKFSEDENQMRIPAPELSSLFLYITLFVEYLTSMPGLLSAIERFCIKEFIVQANRTHWILFDMFKS